MFNEMGNAMRESKQQQAAEQTTEVSKKTDVKEESIEGQNSRSSFGLCSVCLDNVSHPAALPCGHICCWNCIMPYAIKQQNDCKCPVCRSEFESRNVLALCNYS